MMRMQAEPEQQIRATEALSHRGKDGETLHDKSPAAARSPAQI